MMFGVLEEGYRWATRFATAHRRSEVMLEPNRHDHLSAFRIHEVPAAPARE
jgi:hypothetical protein